MDTAVTMTGNREAIGLRTMLMVALLLLLFPRLASAPLIQAGESVVRKEKIGVVDVDPGIGIDPSRQSQWLDHVAEFFRMPMVNVALIALGLIGLIFEFKMPGTTFPGSVAAVCFVLFFWAHSFVGQFTLLAILLFLLGLVFLGIEIFVVPGLCFSGVAGVVLLFVGLLLVTLDHWPTGQDDWNRVGSTFGTLAIGLALAIGGALGLTYSLPSIPFLNRMVLTPPGDLEESGHPAALSLSGSVHLLGAIGVAVTPLRPSGKAQFGEQFIDVIAEGDYVPPGGRVQVIELEGMRRIIVKEV